MDHPDHKDHKFIVTATRNFSTLIHSYEDLRILYTIPRDQLFNFKNERDFFGIVQGVVFHPVRKHSNHLILWGFHLDIYNLHDGLDGRNLFWQSI